MPRQHHTTGTTAAVHSSCDPRSRTGIARTRRVAVVLLAALVAAVLGTVAPAAAADASPAMQEAEFVSRINQLRIGLGLSPLTVDRELTSVGRSWAAGMASAGRISHNGDYPYLLSLDWEIGAENVGAGSNVEVLMAAFVNSPGHYANLVNPALTRVGVGVVPGGDGRIYTSHQFARVRGDRPGPTALSVSPASGITTPAGFAPVSPAARVLDTRRDGRPAAGTIFTLDLSTVPGVDASTTAVALSITADAPAASGYVSAWPAHLPQPATSVLNYAPGVVSAARSSWVLVPISPDRRLRLFTSASVHLIADIAAITSTDRVEGYAAIGAAPVRLHDSRAGAPLAAGDHRVVSLGAVGVPGDATLVAINVTGEVDGVSGGVGYISAAPTPAVAPSTSTVSVAPGSPRANFALVPVGPGGTITLYASVGAHVIVDVAGYVAPSAPGRYVAVTPTRVADTRVTRTMVTPGERRLVPLPFAGLPGTPVTVVGTVTVADPVTSGWAATSDASTGTVSNVNFAAGLGATAAGVMTPIPTGGSTTVVASTVADVIVDVTGVIVGG